MTKKSPSSSAGVSTSLSAESADCALNDFDSVKNSLNDVLSVVESLKTKSSFEATINSTIQVLIKHMQVISANCSVVSSSVDTVETEIARTDQYARRNTVMVTGIDYKRETETFNELTETVATELSKSGVPVSTSDFAACHRNGNRIRNVTRNGKTVKTPPSVTVRFYNCHKKDNVLNNYKNHENGKQKKIKVVQSINTHYQNLKTNVSNFCRDNNMKVKWIHWRSSSAGLCIKLDDDSFYSRVHCMTDFTKQYLKNH